MSKTSTPGEVKAAPALLALGGNLPVGELQPRQMLVRAIHRLAGQPWLDLLGVSRFFASPASPAGSGPDYVNAAARVATSLSPEELLARLHEIEAGLGRRRDGRRWRARGIDLDLLAVGDTVLPDAATQATWRGLSPGRQAAEAPDRLILPHPRMQDRAFVLVPLAEVAPGWVHPATGLSVARMLAALDPAERVAVRPVGVPDCA